MDLKNAARRRRPSVTPLSMVVMLTEALFVAPAGHAGDAANEMERWRYQRQFNAIVERLRDREAARAARDTLDPARPWTAPDQPPPRHTLRDVPARGFPAVVARASTGSWRQAGDLCTMSGGGRVEVLGSDPDAGGLVRYALPTWSRAPQGDDCAAGTLSFVPFPTLFDWPAPGAVGAQRHDLGVRLGAAADRVLDGAKADDPR